MKTRMNFRLVLLAAALLVYINSEAQVTVPFNNPGTPGADYVGWNGSTTVPLMIRHNGNQPIQWFTDSIQRMQLYHAGTPNINGYNVVQNGYLGISQQPAFFAPGADGPFSRLHLVDSASNNATVYAQQIGFRPWQRNGITMTGNSDQCYIGQKYNNNQNDNSDLVLQWSDNPANSNWGTDRLRFLFTSWSQGANYGARSTEGLESFRIYVPNDTSAFVGIGDFYRASILAGSTVDPTERLDVLDRTIRIRQLVPDYYNDTLDRYVVADHTGRLQWRFLPAAGTGSCDWYVNNAGKRVVTAYNGTTSCNTAEWRVGIGTASPNYKLSVEADETACTGCSATGGLHVGMKSNASGGSSIGLNVRTEPATGETTHTLNGIVNYSVNAAQQNHAIYSVAQTTTGSVISTHGAWAQSICSGGTVANSIGLRGLSDGTSGSITNGYGVFGHSVNAVNPTGVYGSANAASATNGVGVHGYCYGATNDYGVKGEAVDASGTKNHGLYGRALGATNNYGIWAEVQDTSANNWAGHFQGKVKVTGNMWHNTSYIFSDESLKQDASSGMAEEDPIGTLASQLSLLNPRNYTFTDEAKERLLINGGTQFGFFAQEVEQVFPQLVPSMTLPAELDSLGNEIAPALALKGVNYVGLIPLLVAGHKEQQATVAQQQAEIAALTEQVAANQAAAEELQELRNRLDQLEQLLAACCQNPDGGTRDLIDDGTGLNDLAGDRNLRIQPNPFNEQTTVYYNLERSGRMQLMANGSDGKHLRVLHEAQMEAGQYQYEWQTADLSAGIYYVTLLLDGEPIVKKAVKVN